MLGTQDKATKTTAGDSRDRAYGSFTKHLLSRDLRAGQFVSQRELVDMTGLTLGAIRELIPRLVVEGLIRTVPKRGMQIVHVDLHMIRDAFQFRKILEAEAIRSFARNAEPQTIRHLRDTHEAIIDKCQRAEAQDGITPALIDEAQAVDLSLHETIIDALGNKIIRDAYHGNSIKIRLIKLEQTTLNSALVVPTMQEHVKIIEAIEARDPERSVMAMEKHIENARQRAIEQP